MTVVPVDRADRLSLDRMIFHGVGPDASDLVLLDEVDPACFRPFFLDRVKETLAGNAFRFQALSPVRQGLAAVTLAPESFAAQSQALARLFHTHHTGNTKRGVFFVIELTLEGERLYSLIKYDHQKVLTYRLDRGPAGLRAIIDEIVDTFVEEKQALQKSALIRLTPDGGDADIIDRTVRQDISTYFKAFLGVERAFSAADLTRALNDAAVLAGRKCQDQLTDEVKTSLLSRVHDTMETLGAFEPDAADTFLAGVFGPLPEDSALPERFQDALRQHRLAGESFAFDMSGLSKPEKREIVTEEGIRIVYPSRQTDQVTVSPDGRTITIRTVGIRSHGEVVSKRRPRGD
jgi:hypothetical protein